jgi:hypothetical protein
MMIIDTNIIVVVAVVVIMMIIIITNIIVYVVICMTRWCSYGDCVAASIEIIGAATSICESCDIVRHQASFILYING